jgi:hypothetical protein
MSEASQDAPGTLIAGAGEVPEQGVSTRGCHGRRKLRVLLAAGAVAATAVGMTAALLAGSPGDPPTALAALNSALAKTSAESYGFSMDSTEKYAGQVLNSTVVSGAFDPRHELGAELLTRRTSQPSRRGLQIRFIGEYVYTRVSPGSGFTITGKPWDKAPLPPTGTNVPGGGYSFASDRPVSPDALLAVLQSTATVRDSGSASGPGWTGFRYTFTARLGPQSSVTGTVYIDKQGRVRDLMTTATEQNGLTTERDFTFSGFGAPVQVTAPPAAQARYSDSVLWGFFF